MTSKIKVDNINKVSDDSNIIKKCGTTTTIGSGASNPIVVDGSAVTLGRCGGTVALASGATQTGFGRTGTVDWQTSIKTSTITAVNGEGYFVNTTGGAITANLPAGVVGAIVSFKDYAQTFDTNALTISANGSEKIQGQTFDLNIGTEGAAVTLVYGDSTQGWQAVNSNEITNASAYVNGSGGTETTSGDYKIHTFTGPGTFTVSNAGNAAGSTTMDYMVVAGGGGGGNWASGGGGGGGFRESVPSPAAWTASPIANPGGALTASIQAYPITVGGAGAGSAAGPGSQNGVKGGNSIFSTITSAGGGYGAGYNVVGGPGGSGGGGGHPDKAGGAGDDPDVTPNQGFPGGVGNTGGPGAGAGAGGATEVGEAGNRSPGNFGAGRGGAGATSSITASPVGYSGGGGGGSDNTNMGGASPCGSGGQGGGANNSPRGATAGATNRGGGGGAVGGPSNPTGGSNGGSGIVVVRYKFQN